MALKLTAEVLGGDELKAAFDQLGGALKQSALERAGLAGALPILNAAKEKAPRKTSTLARSLSADVGLSAEGGVEIEIGTDVIYARIQEYGGTIRAKGKFLAIPVTSGARSAGSPRLFPGDLRFVGSSRGGTLRDAGGQVQYALVPSVTLTAHPYLRPAFDEQQDAATAEVGRALAELLDVVR